MIREARGVLAWFLRRGGFGGICLPPFGVFILPERLHEKALIRHEFEHWQQARRLGLVRFYSFWLWYTFRYGYWNNPLEIEARKAERQ